MAISAEAVVNALRQFYTTNDESLRRNLNDWLMNVQISPDVWRIAWNLLQPDYLRDDVAVKLFAASCLYQKISRGQIDELLNRCTDSENAEMADKHLRDSLIDICSRTESKLVKNKLASALAAYICHCTPDIWPDALEDISKLWMSSQPVLLLDVLSYIPRESEVLFANIERKAALRGVLRSQQSLVSETISLLLQHHPTDAEIPEAAVKGVESWVDFCKDASEWQGIVALCLQCAAKTRGATLSAVSKFFCYFIENSDLRKMETFLGSVFDFLASMIAAVCSNSEEENEDIVNMFVALLENHTTFVLERMNDRESVRFLLNGMLNLSNAPGYFPADETSSGKTFNFWLNLFEDALVEQDAAKRTAWINYLRPTYHRLSDILLTKLKFPSSPVYSTWSAEDKEQFVESYRSDGSDIFACCFRMLSGTNFVQHVAVEKFASALPRVNAVDGTGWEELEVILFALEAGGDYASSDDPALKAFFERHFSNAPFSNSTIANTGLRLVSKCSHVISGDSRLLKPVLGDVVIKFLNEPATVASATVALETLTRDAGAVLAAEPPLCSTIVSAAFSCFGDQRFELKDKLRALSSVGYVLSTQPSEVILAHLNEFLVPRLQRLQSMVEGKSQPCTKDELLMEFDVMGCLISALGAGVSRHSSSTGDANPVYLIVSQSFGLFETLYAASGADADVATKIIDTLKRALTTIMDDIKLLLPQFCRIITLLFPPHAQAVSLAKPILHLFANDESFAPMLVELFNGLLEKLSTRETEDAVEICLSMCHQLAKKQWNFFTKYSHVLNYDLSIQIACRTIGNRASGSPAVRNASQYLCELLSHSDSYSVAGSVEKYGGQIMTACFQRVQVEILMSCVDYVADVMWSLTKFSPQEVAHWQRNETVAAATSNPLVVAMFKEVGNKRKFREYAKQFNITCRRQPGIAGR